MPGRSGLGIVTPDPVTWGQQVLGTAAPVPLSLATPAWVNIARASAGSGTVANPWTGWDTAIPWATLIAQGAKFYAPAGNYQAVSSPAGWATNNFNLLGDGPNLSLFKFTQAGDGFSIIYGAYSNGSGIIIQDIGLTGTASTTNAFHFKGCGGLTLCRLKVIGGCTAAGLLLEGIIDGDISTFTCSAIDGGFAAATPVNGIKVDQFAGGQPSTALNFWNAKLQTNSADQLFANNSSFCTVYGGYFDGSTSSFGINLSANSSKWTLIGVDCETNNQAGISDASQGALILGGQTIGGAVGSVVFQSNASGYALIGGAHNKVVNAAGALGGLVGGIVYNSDGTGSITDTATNLTTLPNWNATAATLDINTVRDVITRTRQYALGGALTITANAITPTREYHTVGAGLLKTINLPTTINGNTITAGFRLTVLPTAAFTYDATGNIGVVLSGTATISKFMDFVWDGTKWWPSY